jgi:hypothetical protein
MQVVKVSKMDQVLEQGTMETKGLEELHMQVMEEMVGGIVEDQLSMDQQKSLLI